MTASQLKSKLIRLQSEITAIAGESLLEHSQEVAGLLVLQQQQEHQDSDGNPLRPYSRNTYNYKRSEGRSGLTDFDNTGAFHAGMNVSVNDNTFSINSPAKTDMGELKSAWLTDWNESKGGGKVMKLSDDKKPIVWRIIKPTFIQKCRSILKS